METNFENQIEETQVMNIDPEQSPLPAEGDQDEAVVIEESDDLEDDSFESSEDDSDLDEDEDSEDEGL